MVADTDELDQDALSEDDDGADEEGKQDRLHGVHPAQSILAGFDSDKLHHVSTRSSVGFWHNLQQGK